MNLSKRFSVLGITLIIPLGLASAVEVLTSAYDPSNGSATTAVFPIDFASTTTNTYSPVQYQTWNSPKNNGVKYFDISPYVPGAAQCIEVSWWNTGNSASYIPDYIAFVNSSTGWKTIADDNNLSVTPATGGSGSYLPAFRISGQGYLGQSYNSIVRVSAYSTTSNDKHAFLRIRHRHDLSQAQCETDGNWPVVRFNGTNHPIIVR